MVLFRRLLGEVLRRHRQRQGRTLRDVASAARVSLGYLSEVERGVKEASSELLTSVCEALGVSLADVLREVSDDLVAIERRPLRPVGFVAAGAAAGGVAGARPAAARRVAGVAALTPARGPAPARIPAPAAVRRDDDGDLVAVPSAAPAGTGAAEQVAPVTSLSVRGLPVVAA